MHAPSPKRTVVFLFLLLVLAPVGCAPAAGTGSSASAAMGGRRASNRIDAAELESVSELDAYEAISRLRPAWLRAGSRGSMPEVILDGSPQRGGLDVLRSLRAADVSGLELMSASDATTRFGTGYTNGAIVATTKR